ncbi:MAG: universal stress protein [Synechococcales bacterium]|nr:universal stress protein [Synechococcales bacterium]
MSFKRIIAALHQSPLQSAILNEAIDLAHHERAALRLVHAVDMPTAVAGATPNTIPPASGMAMYPAVGVSPNPAVTRGVTLGQQDWDETVQRIEQWLQGLQQDAIARGVDASYEFRNGQPGDQICQVATEWRADLVVVGRRGRSGLSEAFLGSVSNYVVHHAPCAVLTLQATEP